jgi:hypothetical protein
MAKRFPITIHYNLTPSLCPCECKVNDKNFVHNGISVMIQSCCEEGGFVMATAILFYSLTGKTKTLAERAAAETGAGLFEIREVKKRNGFTAFFPGVFQAGGLKRTAIEPLGADLASYDEIVIMGPIWAGNPAPAVNSAIGLLPEGKTVSLICTSGRGGYDLPKTAALIAERGCTVKEARGIENKGL